MAGTTEVTHPADAAEGADGAEEADRLILIRLAADLDAGFVELMGVHGRTLYSVALSVTGRPADAEDLVAEALLRAYRALRGFDRTRLASLRPRPWLVTILLNLRRNGLRDARRRPKEVSLEQVAEPPQDTGAMEERMEMQERRRRLVEMIRDLPERQRVAVVLRHVVGLPIAEIAGILDCPEGTAKSHISRGLEGLRRRHERSDSS